MQTKCIDFVFGTKARIRNFSSDEALINIYLFYELFVNFFCTFATDDTLM